MKVKNHSDYLKNHLSSLETIHPLLSLPSHSLLQNVQRLQIFLILKSSHNNLQINWRIDILL